MADKVVILLLTIICLYYFFKLNYYSIMNPSLQGFLPKNWLNIPTEKGIDRSLYNFEIL